MNLTIEKAKEILNPKDISKDLPSASLISISIGFIEGWNQAIEKIDAESAKIIRRLEEHILGEQAISRLRYLEIEKLKREINELKVKGEK